MQWQMVKRIKHGDSRQWWGIGGGCHSDRWSREATLRSDTDVGEDEPWVKQRSRQREIEAALSLPSQGEGGRPEGWGRGSSRGRHGGACGRDPWGGSALSADCLEPGSILCRGVVGSDGVFTGWLSLLWRTDLKLAYAEAVEVAPAKEGIGFTQWKSFSGKLPRRSGDKLVQYANHWGLLELLGLSLCFVYSGVIQDWRQDYVA